MINLKQQKEKFELEKESRDLGDQQHRLLEKITLSEIERIANVFKDFYAENGITFRLDRNLSTSSPRRKMWEATHGGQHIAELIIDYRDSIHGIEVKIYDEKHNIISRRVSADYIVQTQSGPEIIGGIKVITPEELKQSHPMDNQDPIVIKRNHIARTKELIDLMESNGRYRYYSGTANAKQDIDDWKSFLSKFYE